MNTSPLVTAIITTHNRKDLLPRAIDSVLSQSYPSIEVIVVDDASTDGTPELVASYQKSNPELIYIRFESSVGACKARNEGIKRASGQFISGLDDDDVWHRDRIRSLIDAYDPQYSFITSQDCYVLDEGGRIVSTKPNIVDANALLFINHVGNQVLVEKERLLAIGGFDEQLVAAQDYDTWMRLVLKFGAAKIIDDALQDIYMDTSIKRITTSSKKFIGYFQFYKKHKGRMTRDQRKVQLANLYISRGKRMSLRRYLMLRCAENKKEILRHYVMRHHLKESLKPIYAPVMRFLRKFNDSL